MDLNLPAMRDIKLFLIYLRIKNNLISILYYNFLYMYRYKKSLCETHSDFF
jgi:hypothetical protein